MQTAREHDPTCTATAERRCFGTHSHVSRRRCVADQSADEWAAADGGQRLPALAPRLPALARAALPNRAVFRFQGGAAARRRGPALAPASAFGKARPARAGPPQLAIDQPGSPGPGTLCRAVSSSSPHDCPALGQCPALIEEDRDLGRPGLPDRTGLVGRPVERTGRGPGRITRMLVRLPLPGLPPHTGQVPGRLTIKSRAKVNKSPPMS